jgi:hypothetical protein
MFTLLAVTYCVALNQEKMLPGVLMSSGGQVFEMLYQLADLDEPK